METATATAESTQTNTRRTGFQNAKAAQRQTFQKWLTEEANAGRMILATGNGKPELPAKPGETVDFWPAYNETRADRG